MGFFKYVIENKDQIITLLLEHIQLTVLAVGIAVLIGIPLGILINYVQGLKKPIISLANVVQAIPSMALLGFAIPLLGIGATPAILMVILYSLLPVIKNTSTGIENINPNMLEAAKGIGLTKAQRLMKIEIPLALPIIMAGVRIAAVTAVGLMTMAAFIGGGGLGYLVFSGIRTVNNDQILAGALPACILALSIDFLLGIAEKLVTPISMQKEEKRKKSQRKTQKAILLVTAIVLLAIFIPTAIKSMDKDNQTIVIGSKDFTEQELLGHIVSGAIESETDISVTRKLSLGGTQVVFSALKSGEVDLYVDYSGTVYGDILKYPPVSDVEKVYNTVKDDMKKKYEFEVLPQLGFNNTYTLAVKKETVEQYQLKTISDLAKVANSPFVITASLEFVNRKDGILGLKSAYNLNFKKEIAVDGSARYTALMNNQSDVIDAYSTDGLLKKYNLTILEDDQNFFPPYYAIPIVRGEILEEYPEIVAVTEKLGKLLTNEVMIGLNYEIDELNRQPIDVANDFLKKNGYK